MLHFSAAAHARRGPRGGYGGHMQLDTPSIPRPDLDVLWLLGNLRKRLQIRALSRSLLRCFLATFLLTCYTQAYIQSECAAQLSQLCCRTAHTCTIYMFSTTLFTNHVIQFVSLNNNVLLSKRVVCDFVRSHEILRECDEKYVLLLTKASMLMVFNQLFTFSSASFDLLTRGLLPQWS